MFKKSDWIFGLISVAIGIFVLINVANLHDISSSMDPAGPAALPSIIAWIMIAIGLVHITVPVIMIQRERINGSAVCAQHKDSKSFMPVILITLASVIYISILSFVSYPIAMPLLIAAVMFSLGVRDMKKIAIASIATTIILFVSFSLGLSVDLPLGFFERFF